MDVGRKRSPIGVMPHFIWIAYLECPNHISNCEREGRIKMLNAAIIRYESSNFKPPNEWFLERDYQQMMINTNQE